MSNNERRECADAAQMLKKSSVFNPPRILGLMAEQTDKMEQSILSNGYGGEIE